MQMHHGFDVNGVRAHTVNNGVREAMKVELAIVAPHFAPAFRFGDDAAQCVLKLVKEVIAQARLPVFVPQCPGFQLLIGFRMADDVHGAWRECPGRFPPPDDK